MQKKKSISYVTAYLWSCGGKVVMKLVEKHFISKNNPLYKEIDELSFLSKNLYNAALYRVRQQFFKTNTFLSYESLQKKLQDEKQADYYALPTKVSQQILRLTCKNFESFFKAKEEYKQNPQKFKSPPKIPKYKDKSKGRNIVPYPIDAINTRLLREKQVKLSMSKITLPCKHENVKQVRLVPRYGVYKVEIVYEKSPYLFTPDDIQPAWIQELCKQTIVSQYLKDKFSKSLQAKIDLKSNVEKLNLVLRESISDKLNSLLKTSFYDKEAFKNICLSKKTKQLLSQKLEGEELLRCNRLLLEDAYPQIKKHKDPQSTLDQGKIAGIDIGLNNLAAITSNQKNFQPVLINGRPLKSINQYFNKKRAQLMSFVNNRGTSNRIEKLTHKRNCLIDNYLHHSSKYIIELLVREKVGTLVVGKNDGWKQEVKIGKKNNQNFVSVPHAVFIKQLQYKGEMAGIKVLVSEESYTSKCSVLDGEEIKKHQKYKGRRVKRGLFESSKSRRINADINASANIIKKVIPNAFANGIEGLVVGPKRINPLKAKCHI